MKRAPSFTVAATVVAALAAGALLAAEDRMLFEPQHASLVGVVVDEALGTWSAPEASQRPAVLPAVTRAGSAVQERR